MATDKKKKEVKVRDLKPSKDAKGGARTNTASLNRANLSGSTFGGGGSASNSIGRAKGN